MQPSPRKDVSTRRWCVQCGRESHKPGRCETCGISLISLVSDDGLPKLRALSEAMRLERETELRNAAMVCGVALGFVLGFVIVALIPALWDWSLVVPLAMSVVGAFVGSRYLARWLVWRANRRIARRPHDGGHPHP